MQLSRTKNVPFLGPPCILNTNKGRLLHVNNEALLDVVEKVRSMFCRTLKVPDGQMAKAGSFYREVFTELSKRTRFCKFFLAGSTRQALRTEIHNEPDLRSSVGLGSR